MPFNDTVETVLQIARDEMATSAPGTQTSKPAGAVAFAVLQVAEQEWGLPVVVKYGDAPAVLRNFDADADRVFGRVCVTDNSRLFSVEPTKPLEPEQLNRLNELFCSIGAWYIGTDTPRYGGKSHILFLWPECHPVTALVEDDE